MSQRDAVDLFVTTKLIEAEKPQVVGFFLDEYLHAKVDTPHSKVGAYIDAFAKVDRRGLFFPMLLQKLEFLGQKVFGCRKDQRICEEVDGLVWFLERVADRKVGDEGDLDFDREYCRFAIVIIGRSYNVTSSGEVWTRYIANKLIPRKIEVIYLLGSLDNREVIDTVAAAVCSTFEICRSHRMRAPIRYPDDREVQRDQYLVILRKRGVPLVQASA